MNKYLNVSINNKLYRFLLNNALEEKLKGVLKDKYLVDTNNNLVMDNLTLEEQYAVKQILFAGVLDELKKANLNESEQTNLKNLEEKLTLKKNTVYSSDLSELESSLEDLNNLYNDTKDRETKKEQVDASITTTPNEEEGKSTFKELLNDIEKSPELKDAVPTEKINEVINKIKVCTSSEEYEELTGNKSDNFDIEEINFAKDESIILPPNVDTNEIITAVISTYCNSNTIDKIVTLMSEEEYSAGVKKAFDKLRSDIKIKGLNTRNLNYFGDEFLDQFEALSKESGTNIETMFDDYFNGYDANRKYHTYLDWFIRQFFKYNGGNVYTRPMLEALIVKKAYARNLISYKYNKYLDEEYRYTKVNDKGYVKFQDKETKNGTIVKGEEEKTINPTLTQNSSVETSETLSDLKSTTTTDSQLNTQTDANISTNTNISTNASISTNTNIVNPPKGGIDGVNPDLEFQAKTESAISNGTSAKGSTANKTANLNQFSNPELNMNVIKQKNRLKKGITGVIGSKIAGAGLEENIIGGASFGNAAPEDVAAPLENYRKNNYFNNRVSNGSASEEVSDTSSDELNDNELTNNEENYSDDKNSNNTSENQSDSASNNDANTENTAPLDKDKNPVKNLAKNAIGTWAKKHVLLLIGVGGGIILLVILLVVIFGGGSGGSSSTGYIDSTCNYNNVNITLTSCEDTSTVLLDTTIDDFILKMSYLYTKENTYSDETIKAMMIVLKTNTLSYGNYYSGANSIEVPICSLKDDYDESIELPFEGFENVEDNLNLLYEEINEYLYVSSSYQSSLNSLSSYNALEFNTSKLNSFEEINGTYDTILSSSYETEAEEETIVYKETLFVGDSRIYGMNLGVNEVNDNNSVYATGKGYKWFINEATASNGTNATNGGLKAIESKLKDNVSYNIILWLGINDLSNVNNYFNKYQELALNDWQNHEIYVVSVGPVNDEASSTVKNENINTFNNTMRELITNAKISNLHYLDLNITSDDISISADGIHYNSSGYQTVYDIIMNSIGTNISSTLALYKLTDYCAYYTLTENDAYWWPVGSASATNGNIYGGEPTSTVITSTFGYRDTDIPGATANHAGVDIAKNGVACGDVVIATKSGTVTKVTDDGGARGTYIIIDHGDGIETLYQHLIKGSYTVAVGDTVSQGQKIGLIGDTGVGSGCHLHFEVHVNGTPVNPLDYISVDNPRPTNDYIASISGTSGDYKNMLCSSLLSSGFSKNATIGIMANVYHESGYNPINLQNSYEKKLGYTDQTYTAAVDNGTYTNFANDHAGYGLVQWTSAGRKARLYAYKTTINATSIGSFDFQYKYLLYELENYYPNTYKYVTSNETAINIGAYWCDHFESPAGSEPCSVYGNCPSSHCVNRTTNDINSQNLTAYVNNGCQD